MEDIVELKEWGNSYAIRIPKKKAHKFGFRKGQHLRLRLETSEKIEPLGLCKGCGPFKRDPNDDFRW